MIFLRKKKLIENSVSKDADPDQMTHSVLSDLGLQCLSMSHKRMLYLHVSGLTG